MCVCLTFCIQEAAMTQITKSAFTLEHFGELSGRNIFRENLMSFTVQMKNDYEKKQTSLAVITVQPLLHTLLYNVHVARGTVTPLTCASATQLPKHP